MIPQTFHQLVHRFCRLTGLPDSECVMQGKYFRVAGIQCALLYREHLAPGLVFAYVVFGDPPQEQESEALPRLLEQNFIGFTGKGPCFSLSPLSGDVVYVEHFPLGATAPHELADALVRLAAKAAQWRSHHFLQVPAATAATTMPAGSIFELRT